MTDPTTPSNAFEVLLHATGRRLTGKQYTNEHGQTVKEIRDTMSYYSVFITTEDGKDHPMGLYEAEDAAHAKQQARDEFLKGEHRHQKITNIEAIYDDEVEDDEY